MAKPSEDNRPNSESLSGHAVLLIAILLVAIALAVYLPVLRHDFTNYDDDSYITENRHIQSGVTKDSVVWAFTSFYESNWHPLTWISHMLDYRLFGPKPAGHHAVNLLFHALNTLVLFLVLRRMTKSVWKSAFVAALFAIHPLHVESVAWAAERKDVLSAFFWVLAIRAYVVYAERPKLKWYMLVALFFGLGLLSKPSLVTLPFVLLLLDYWPLGRFAGAGKKGSGWRLILEKMPLFAMSAASSVVTFYAQQASKAVISTDRLPLAIRAANALVAYVTYIGKMFWPRNLAIFYPHPGDSIPEWQVVGAFVLLACVTILALGLARRHPYLPSGWLWYLGTLVPMIGLVQVGEQAVADRYTYLSYIGLFVILAWGVPDAVRRGDAETRRHGEAATWALSVSAAVVLGALVVAARIQVGYWRDSETLFSHALNVTQGNYLAHNNLGVALTNAGDSEGAIAHYLQAIQIKPRYPEARYNLGNAYARQGRVDDAVNEYEEALRANPDYADAHFNLGVVLDGRGDTDGAIRHYREAISAEPDDAEAHANLAIDLYAKGDYADAWDEVRLCRRYGGVPNPDFVKALSAKMPEPRD